MKTGFDPTISVIIPTYNRANLVGQAIKSVLEQTFRDFELLVIDDCSSDDTEKVVSEFNDARITFFQHDENRGGAAARNTGIRNSMGQYIAFLDSDDRWLKDKLRLQLDRFEGAGSDAGLVFTKYKVFHEDGSMEVLPDHCVEGDIHDMELWKDHLPPTSAIMIKRKCIAKTGFFDENLPARQDYDLWLRITKYFEVAPVRKTLVHFFEDNPRISDDLSARLEGSIAIIDKIISDRDLSVMRKRRVAGFHYFNIGKELAGNLKVTQAHKIFQNAITFAPYNVRYLLYFLLTINSNFYQLARKFKRKIIRKCLMFT